MEVGWNARLVLKKTKKAFMGREESSNVNGLIWATLLYRFGHPLGIDAEIYEWVYSQLKVPFRGVLE